ncbi:MAG: UGMP family protein [Thermoproteota archaeon]|nr:MAG: UGMP family protein [Candidatus Korarchaeota archaeon]
MLSLGIESTAHTLGVAVVDSRGRIVADERAVYTPPSGGIKPQEASEHHYHAADKLISRVFSLISPEEIDIVCFSRGPGLPPCLSIGAIVARTLAYILKKPLIGVNHCTAHVELARLLSGFHNPVVVYVSGGNTQVIAYSEGRYRVLGETEDIGLGNAQDKLARELGIPNPPGPYMDRVVGRWIDLPYTVKGMNLAYSGLVTEAIKRAKQGAKMEDVIYSFMEVSFSMLVEVAERALAHIGKKQLVLTGGVAASPKLREKFRLMCRERGAEFYAVEPKLARDNGVMIAWTGILAYMQGKWEGESWIMPNWRIDDDSWELIDLSTLREEQAGG